MRHNLCNAAQASVRLIMRAVFLQASPLTVTVLGRQKSVSVSGELLNVSLLPVSM